MKQRFSEKTYLILLVICTISVLIATHIPQSVMNETIDKLMEWDKLIHIAAYGTIAWLALAALRRQPRKSWISVLICIALLAIADEYTQSFVGRVASPYDFLADMVGVLLAMAITLKTQPRPQPLPVSDS